MENIIKFIESILYWWVGVALAAAIIILLVLVICIGVKSHKKTKLIKEYKGQLVSLQSRYDTVLKEKDELTTKCDDLTQDIKTVNLEYMKLEDSVDETVDSLNSAKVNLEDAKKEISLYKEKLNTSVEIITTLKKENGELREKLADANKNNEVLLSAINLKKEANTNKAETTKKKPTPVTGKYAELGRRELFKKAHEVGLGNFAQWSNAKLAKEIEKKEATK